MRGVRGQQPDVAAISKQHAAPSQSQNPPRPSSLSTTPPRSRMRVSKNKGYGIAAEWGKTVCFFVCPRCAGVHGRGPHPAQLPCWLPCRAWSPPSEAQLRTPRRRKPRGRRAQNKGIAYLWRENPGVPDGNCEGGLGGHPIGAGRGASHLLIPTGFSCENPTLYPLYLPARPPPPGRGGGGGGEGEQPFALLSVF